jgi:hypothetical protein
MVCCVMMVMFRRLNAAPAISGHFCRRVMVMMAGSGVRFGFRRHVAGDVQRAVQGQRDHRHERQARGDPLNETVVAASHSIAVPGWTIR